MQLVIFWQSFLIAFSSVSSVVCLTAGNFIFLLLSLVFLAFSIALMYGRVRQRSAFYLPSLIALHTFFSFELCYFSFQVVALILSVNNNVVRGYRSYNSPSVEKQFAQIFLFQLVIGGLCIFGYVSNIIYRDYVYIKNRQKPVTKSSSTPSISIVSKADLEKKEKNDAAGIPRLYI
ncbi:hypothetical protein M3Y97_00021800 [Aphelenchoides bicaudatus]|nr:hypothetical protein M3Y97_00021800 [Aphelenchoides bicaudatus]